VTIDLSFLPDRVEIAVGQQRDLELPSYAGSGNAWSVACLSGCDTAQARVELRPDAVPRPVARAGEGPPAPFLVPEVLTIRGLRPGRSRWKLTLARDFAPRPPTAEHELDVDVM